MLFSSVAKHTELCGPFFKLLTLITETQNSVSGLPCFTQLVLHRVWEAAEYCPHSALEWLAFQAPKNKIAHAWILQSVDAWLEAYLLAHSNARVRSCKYYSSPSFLLLLLFFDCFLYVLFSCCLSINIFGTFAIISCKFPKSFIT